MVLNPSFFSTYTDRALPAKQPEITSGREAGQGVFEYCFTCLSGETVAPIILSYPVTKLDLS